MSTLQIPVLAGLGTAANIALNTTLDGEIAFSTDTNLLFVRYSGTVYQISGGGGFAIGDAVSGGTNDEVLYIDSSGNLACDSNFQWIKANQQLLLVGSGAHTCVGTTQGALLANLGDAGNGCAGFFENGTYTVKLVDSGEAVYVTDGTRHVVLCDSGTTGLTVSDGTMSLNGNPYTWPSSAGTAGQVLTWGTAGALSWSASGTVAVGNPVGSSTHYDILSVDGSGNLAEISPSTSGDVLTSNGTSAAATFQPPVSSLVIGGAVGSGTAGCILYVDGSGNLAQSTDLEFDASARALNLGIGFVSVGGSIGGTLVGNMPFQGTGYKRILFYLDALQGNATWTFPVTWTQIPQMSPTAIGGVVVSGLSTTAVTISCASPTTGWIEFFGY